MSDIRLVKKDKDKLKNIKFGISSTGVKKLEVEADESFQTLQKYREKLDRQEYMSKYDLKAYESAMNSYVENSNRLRGLGKTLGQSYTEEEEKTWNDSVSSMQSGYKEISDYFSKFENEKDFKDAMAAFKQQENMRSEDVEAGMAEVNSVLNGDELTSLKEQKAVLGKGIKLSHRDNGVYLRQHGYDKATANKKLSEIEAQISKIEKSALERKEYLTRAKYLQNYYYLTENDVSLEELESHLNDEDRIAYTDPSGKNITWRKLVDDKRFEQEFNAMYGKYSAMPDWKEKSKFVSQLKKKGSVYDIPYEYGALYYPTELELEYMYGDDDLRATITNSLYQSYFLTYGSEPGLSLSHFSFGERYGYDELEDKEKQLATYLYNTDVNAYEEYKQFLKNQLTERHNQTEVQQAYDMAQKHPLGGSLLSVGYSFMGGVEFLTDAAMGETEGGNQNAAISSSIRKGVSDTVDWEIGNWDAFDFLYNSGMSMLDSAVAMGTMGPFGGVALGLSAAGQSVNDALERGLTGKEAFWNGLAAGAFEMIFETISIGQFSALKDSFGSGVKTAIKNIAKSMLVNASEETLTEIANIAYDNIANADFSNYETMVRTYVMQGMSVDQAEQQATRDMRNQVVEAMASGALMGFGFGGIGSVSAHRKAKAVEQSYDAKDISAIISEGLANPGSEAFELAIKAQAKVKEGKSLSAQEILDLQNATTKAFVESDTLKITQAVEARLIELGEGEKASVLANIITKQVAGQKLTLFEKNTLKNSKYGQRVANELSPENIASGDYTSAWAENIGTDVINNEAYNGLYSIARGMLESQSAVETAPTEAAPTQTQKFIDELKTKSKTDKKSVGKVIFEKGTAVDESDLTDTQRANLEGIKLLAEVSTIEFHIFKSTKVGNNFRYTMPDGTVAIANGWYVAGTNEIWLDLNAGNFGQGTMIRTAAHEISHYIKQWSPKKWQVMADLLMESFAKNGVNTEGMLNKQMDKIKRRYTKQNMPSLTKLLDMAYEEFVSDALTDMLTDGSIVNFMAEVKAKDKILWQKIGDAIKSLLEKWGLIVEDYKSRDLETDEAQALSQFEDTFGQLQKMYQEAFVDATEAFAAIGERNLEGTETVQTTIEVAEESEPVEETSDEAQTEEIESVDNYFNSDEGFYNYTLKRYDENIAYWENKIAQAETDYQNAKDDIETRKALDEAVRGAKWGLKGAEKELAKMQESVQGVANLSKGLAQEYEQLKENVKIAQAEYDKAVAERDASGLDFKKLEKIASAYHMAQVFDKREANEWKTKKENLIKVAQKNTTFEGGVMFMARDEGDTSIKEQIKANQDLLNSMDTVASIKEFKIFENKQKALEWVLKRLENTGYKVNRKGFGEIIIDKKRLKKGLSYLKTNEEMLAFAVLPQVLTKGAEIDVHLKHKGRAYDTVTFAAPVVINGQRGNMAAVVRQEGKNYYKVHRLVMPDGSQLILNNKRDIAETAGGVNNNSGLSPADNISKGSIPQTSKKSQEKMPARENTIGERNLEDFAEAKYTEGELKFSERINDNFYQEYLEDMPIDEYNKLTVKKPIKVSKDTYAAVTSARTQLYGDAKAEDIPIIDIINLGEYGALNSDDFYFIRNADRTDFSIIKHTKTLKGRNNKYVYIRGRQKGNQTNRGNNNENGRVGIEGENNPSNHNNRPSFDKSAFRKNVNETQFVEEANRRTGTGNSSSDFGRGVKLSERDLAPTFYSQMGKVMKTPVDNISKTNILASVEGELKLSSRDELTDIEDDPLYPTSKRERSAFKRSFANKTSNLENTEKANIMIYTVDYAYFVSANGYMSGKIIAKELIDGNEELINKLRKDFENGTIILSEGTNSLIQSIRNDRGRGYRPHASLKETLAAEGYEDLDRESHSGNDRRSDSRGSKDSRQSEIKTSERDLALTFYSQMGKVIEEVKQEKLAANSVVNMLRGKGVKAEEIRWSGIVPFLEGKKSVTKQELLDFINSSMLQIGMSEEDAGGTRVNKNEKPYSAQVYEQNRDSKVVYANSGYSYDALTSKPDIVIPQIPNVSSNEISLYMVNRNLFAKEMIAIATKAGNSKNTNTATYLHCKDLGEDVQVTKNSFKHGAARIDASYIAVCKNISNVLENSIVVNELKEKENTNGGYVLLGLAESEDSYIVVRSIVDKKTWKLEDYNELYAIRKKSIKKEDVGFIAPALPSMTGFGTSSTISITNFLKFVNNQKLANSVLPLDVINKLNSNREFDENVTPNLLYSDRDNVSVYDEIGEVDKLIKENEMLKERLKLKGKVTHGEYFNQNQLDRIDENGNDVWYMDINDSMKDSILHEGQVIYSDRDKPNIAKYGFRQDNISRANKQGELINDYYYDLNKSEWKTFYNKIINKGYLATANVGVVAPIVVNDKLIIAERLYTGKDAHDYVVIDAYKLFAEDGDTYTLSLLQDALNKGDIDYDTQRIFAFVNRLNRLDGRNELLARYNRDNSRFDVTFTNGKQERSTDEIHGDSKKEIAGERFSLQDKSSVQGDHELLKRSDRDNVSVYDKIGEVDKLIKENEMLKERLKLEGKVTHGEYFNQNQLDRIDENGNDVWSMDINDSMKDSILHEGQVMYAVGDKAYMNTVNNNDMENIVESNSALMHNKNSPLSFENRASENVRSSINWVYKSKLFSQVENKLFHQKISEINQGSNAFTQNSNGEFMLPIENKIVFTDGDYDSPYISEIVEVLTNYSTEFEKIKEIVFNVEKGKCDKQDAVQIVRQMFGKEFIISYYSGVDGVYGWEDGRRKGKTRRTVISNYLKNIERERNDRRSNAHQIKLSERDSGGTRVNKNEKHYSAQVYEQNRNGRVMYEDRDNPNISFYTETDYNNFGWVRYNNVLTSAEYNTLLSRYADYKHNKHNYPTTRFGEAVIFAFDHPNVLMYVKGTIKKPQITKIFMMEDALPDEMKNEIREEILHNERKRLPFPYQTVVDFYGEEVFTILKARDYETFWEIKSRTKGNGGESSDSFSGNEQDRARGGIESETTDKNIYNKVKLSDRDNISIYDKIGEVDKLIKGNEMLKERLQLEGKVTHGENFNQNQLDSVDENGNSKDNSGINRATSSDEVAFSMRKNKSRHEIDTDKVVAAKEQRESDSNDGRAFMSIMSENREDLVENGNNAEYNNWESYELSSEFIKNVPYSERHTFLRNLANKTNGMKPGERKNIAIITDAHIYFYEASGYMNGSIAKKSRLTKKAIAEFNAWSDYYDSINTSTTTPHKMVEGYEGGTRRNDWDYDASQNSSSKRQNDEMVESSSESNSVGDTWDSNGDFETDEELIVGSIVYNGNGEAFKVNEDGSIETFKFSDRDNVSVYDRIGEVDKLIEENEMLKERLNFKGKVTHGEYFNQNQLDSVDENGNDVWSMDINDSMKDSILHEGQVMYADRDDFTDAEYNKLISKKPIKVSKQDWAKVNSRRTQKYASISDEDIPVLDFIKLAEYNKVNEAYCYVIRNNDRYSFDVIAKKKVKPNFDRIYKEELKDYEKTHSQNDRNGNRERFDRNGDEPSRNRGTIRQDVSSNRESSKAYTNNDFGESNSDSGTKINYSDRDNVSVYDKMGVVDKLVKENEMLNRATSKDEVAFSVPKNNLRTTDDSDIIKNKYTDEEHRADILRYKSGEAYKINAKLRENMSLDETEQYFVSVLDEALHQLPVYKDVTYRNVAFDDFGGEEAYNTFLGKHILDRYISYEQFLSCSKEQDGYPVKGEFQVRLIIESNNARDVDGYGNNMENEVIYPLDSIFIVKNIDINSNIPTIYLQEVISNGRYNTTKSSGNTVQHVQTQHTGHSNLQGVSGRNTVRDTYRGTGSQPTTAVRQRDTVRGDGRQYTVLPTAREEQEINNITKATSKDEVAFSMPRDYSYESLIRKPDMIITQVDNLSLEKNSDSRKEIIDKAVENAKLVGKENENGNAVVYVKDIDTEIVLSKSGLRHGLDRRLELLSPIVLRTGEILKNAVRINELSARDENISKSYVLIGAAKNINNEPYIISFVVNKFTNEVSSVDVLYAINAKKEPAGLIDPSVAANIADYFTGSNISISKLLDCVNKYFPDILPESVLRHYDYDRRPDGKLGESALFSLPIGNRKRAVSNNVIELSKDNELSKRIGDLRGAAKYKVIQQYILEVLSGEEILLSDGKVAVVDKSDALHIANKAANKKTAQISNIKEIVQKAVLVAEEKSIKGRKFDYFYYYEAVVKYDNEIFSVYLDVGRARNDCTYHIYDITNKIRDTANRINGLERPKPKEGYALTNGISNNSINQYNKDVNSDSSTNTDIFEGLSELNVLEKEYVEQICEKLGVQVVFEDLREMVYKKEIISPDGFVKNGVIHINTYAINPIGFVFKHELTHFCEKSSKYKIFAETVEKSRLYKEWIKSKTGKEYLWDAEDAYRQMVYETQKNFEAIDSEKIRREIIADFVGDMLFTDSGSGIFELTSEVEERSRNKVVQFILDFISFIKKKLSGNKNITLELSKLEDDFKRLFAEATFDQELASAFLNEHSNNQDDVSFCFVRCDDLEKINLAEQMENDGANQSKIYKELGVFKNVFGEWATALDLRKFRFYPYGTWSSSYNLIKKKNKIEGKLKDIVFWPELYEKFPEFRDVRVVIASSYNPRDTIRYIKSEYGEMIFLNKETCDAHVENLALSGAKAEMIRTIQKMIQVREGNYIGKGYEFWERLEKAGRLPYSDVLGRYLTADDMMKYYIDEYDAMSAAYRQYAKDIIYYIDRSSKDLDDSFLYKPSVNPNVVFTRNSRSQLVTLRQKNDNVKLPSIKVRNADKTKVSNEKEIHVKEEPQVRIEEKGIASQNVRDFVLSKEKGIIKKRKLRQNRNIQGGNSGFIEKGINDTDSAQKRFEDQLRNAHEINIADVDTIGRKLTKPVKDKLSGSVAINEKGCPISFYTLIEDSDNIFKNAQLGLPIGTIDMVASTYEKLDDLVARNLKCVEFYGVFKNPLYLSGEPYELSVTEIGLQLAEQGLIGWKEYGKIASSPWGQKRPIYQGYFERKLRQKLYDLGFDAIAYENKNHDPGSITLVAFDEEQLILVAEDGLLIPENGINDITYENDAYSSREITAEENTLSLKRFIDESAYITNRWVHQPDSRILIGNSGYMEENTETIEEKIEHVKSHIDKLNFIEFSGYDTVNREAPKEFGNSIFRDKDGRLLSFFTWDVREEFDTEKIVRLGTQLTSFSGAFEMFAQNKKIHPKAHNGTCREVYINAFSPLIVYGNTWNTKQIAKQLRDNKKITEKYYYKLHQMEAIDKATYTNATAKNLKNQIRRLGYDSIIYIRDDGSFGISVFDESSIALVSNNGISVNEELAGSHRYGIVIHPGRNDKTDITSAVEYVNQEKSNTNKLIALTGYLALGKKVNTEIKDNFMVGHSGICESGEINKWRLDYIHDKLTGESAGNIEINDYDVAGRYVEALTKAKVQGTKFVDETGKLLSFFFWNNYGKRGFDHWPVGYPVFTLNAAHEWYNAAKQKRQERKEGVYQEFYIKAENPYVMRRAPKAFTAREFAEDLYENGMLVEWMYKKIINYSFADSIKRSGATAKQIIKTLKSYGYDSIMYMSDTKDPGSIGVILFDENQLSLVSVNGKRIDNTGFKDDNSEDIGLFMEDDEKNVEKNQTKSIATGEKEWYNIITDGSHLVDGQLKPNVKYKTGEYDYIYETDEYGRICRVVAEVLRFTERIKRLKHKAKTPGKEAGDHAGHLIADRFGGSADIDNLVSQSAVVNLSEYKKLENCWSRALKKGKKVSVDIQIQYEGDSMRPSSFEVIYAIGTAKPVKTTIKN